MSVNWGKTCQRRKRALALTAFHWEIDCKGLRSRSEKINIWRVFTKLEDYVLEYQRGKECIFKISPTQSSLEGSVVLLPRVPCFYGSDSKRVTFLDGSQSFEVDSLFLLQMQKQLRSLRYVLTWSPMVFCHLRLSYLWSESDHSTHVLKIRRSCCFEIDYGNNSR